MTHSKHTLAAKGEHTFLVLDALRGVAAISVTVYHFMGYMTSYKDRGLPNADLAVDFFFILSGFVIAYAYEKRILAGQTVGRFMTRRLIRLYPLYWLGITLPMLALTAKNYVTTHALTLSIFPMPYLFGLFFLPTPPSLLPGGEAADITTTNIFPLNHPSWSLSLEIGINLVFVLLCRYMKTPRLIAFVAAGGVAFCAASWIYGSIDLGWSWPGYIGGWARVLWSFFMGFLLYRLYTLKKRRSISLWLGIFLAFFLLGDFACPDDSLAYELANCLFILPLIVWFGARANVWKPAHRVYAWLGRTSYAIYIIHMPLMPIFMLAAQHLKMDPYAHIPLTVAVTTILSLAVAGVLDIIYDIPLRRYLTKVFGSRRPLPAK